MAKQNTNTPNVTKPKMGEIGTRTGYTSIISDYEKEERRLDDIPIDDYRKMRTNDGKVSALVALYTLPIWRMSFNIDPAEDDNGEAEFIEQNFTEPFENGGTYKNFASYLRDMVYFIFDGFRAYEKVWYVDNEGKIRLKKLGLRDATTVSILSEKDELTGIKQGETEIPASKTFLLTYNPSEDPFYGQSILKPVWYHWDKKHKLYYIAHIAAEVQTVPPRIIKHKGMDSNALKTLENAVDRMGLESRVTYNSNTAEVEFLDVSSGAKVNIMELIQHHDNQASKAMLAMWVDLSSEGNAAGSRALGSPMIDIYEQNLESITTIIENEINASIIPQLIQWNFGTTAFPKFRFSPLDQQSEGLIRQAFMEIVKKGLPDKLSMEIIEKIAKRFDIEFDSEEAMAEIEEKAEEMKKQLQMAQQPQQPNANRIAQNPEDKGMQKNVNVEQDKKMGRFSEKDAINLAEDYTGKINLVDYANKIQGLKTKLRNELEDIVNKVSEEVMSVLVLAIVNKDYQAIMGLTLPYKEEYLKTLLKYEKEIYNWSKVKASEELGIATPPTSSDTIKMLELKTSNITEEVFSTLLNSLTAMAMAGIDNGWDKNKVQIGLSGLFADMRNNTVPLGSEQSLGDAFATARTNVFDGIMASTEVVAMRFNNNLEHILRGVVCEYCKSLHGLTVTTSDPVYRSYTPPLHFHCWCFWEPIKKGEDYELSKMVPAMPIYDDVTEYRGKTEIGFAERDTKKEKVDDELIKLVKELANG